MSIFKIEMKQSLKALCIWTGIISFMLVVCVLMFPEMSTQMDSVSDMFANMGSFTSAFGMDQVNFGEIMGFYGIECGNVLGIGGGFFAAYIGISVLSKEEKGRTAEFLLTHPISRASVLVQKLSAVITQLVSMNVVIAAVSAASFAVIGEKIAVKEYFLLHLAYLILQVEIACICFGISAFIKHGSIGIGLGIAALLYFMNIISNISEQAEFLRYITPFTYAQASEIIADAKLDVNLVIIGAVLSAAGIAAGFIKYTKKDISA